MFISIDAEKSLDRIDRPFMIKNSQQNKRNLPQNNQAQV
jgi:hypothetical protein